MEDKLLSIRLSARKNGQYIMNKLFDDYLTGLITKKRIPSCILCGTEHKITKEHILPKWVFQSDPKRFFISDVNQLSQAYINATLPACQTCNSELLNSLERYIQKVLSEVDLKTRFYSDEEWDNIIRWLEIIDYKFQVFDLVKKFIKHKKTEYVPDLADFSIAFMRDFSVRTITTKTRLSLKRIATKNKRKRANALIIGTTKNKSFHYFHKSGQFIFLEIPLYNKCFFYFYQKDFKSDKTAKKEALKIIKEAYNN